MSGAAAATLFAGIGELPLTSDSRSRRGQHDYEPLQDSSLPDDVLNDLVNHRGKWRDLVNWLLPAGADSAQRIRVRDAVAKIVVMGRRSGLVIEGNWPAGGYRYVRFERVPYLHTAKVQAWPPQRERRRVARTG